MNYVVKEAAEESFCRADVVGSVSVASGGCGEEAGGVFWPDQFGA
ncbi:MULTISPECIES: hypothetical protein [Curtobacterium]|nr:hypothetical protein [Curtobacterium citreum]MDK8171667.1 hypothetical protein [Curtobacterium citreum]